MAEAAQGSWLKLSCFFSLLRLREEERQRDTGTGERERPGRWNGPERTQPPAWLSSAHLVEEVDGSEDGEHGDGQSHVLCCGGLSEVRTHPLPPWPQASLSPAGSALTS